MRRFVNAIPDLLILRRRRSAAGSKDAQGFPRLPEPYASGCGPS